MQFSSHSCLPGVSSPRTSPYSSFAQNARTSLIRTLTNENHRLIMNSTLAVLWLYSRSSRSGSYGVIRVIDHILGSLPVSRNHMTPKTEVTCVLERWVSPYRSTRCHNPGDEHLTASLSRSSCTIFYAWRELKAEINKAVDRLFGWCGRGSANVLSPWFEKLQEEIMQKIERICLSEPQQLFVYRTCDVTTVFLVALGVSE
jgi:hypothetical protein